ncbi:MAG: L-threonylcarbamoyladenylate synthase [Patescibacteria group bacterium]
MMYLAINPSEERPAIINLVAGYLKLGKIVVLPTDTIYGFSCLASNQAAIKHIYRLKKRDPKTASAVLVSSLAMLKKYVFVSRRQEQLLKLYWRSGVRATTVILYHRRQLPPELTGGSDGLALRLPKSKFLIKILNRVGTPLVSTSLNISRVAPIADLKELYAHFPTVKRDFDLVVDAGKCRRKKPSRLIDLRNPAAPLILRK